MTRIMSEMRLVGMATTRDDCLAMLDDLTSHFIDQVGGAPWVITDDDVKKVIAQQVAPVLADDQGFCYIGIRTMIYRGPLVKQGNMVTHPGFNVQKSVEEDVNGWD